MSESSSSRATHGCFDALVALVNRLREVHADEAYKSVWIINELHTGPYTGPTYTAELEAAMVAIASAPSEIAPQSDVDRVYMAVRVRAEGSDWKRGEETLADWATRQLAPRSATPPSALVEACRGLIHYWTRNLNNFQWEKADTHVKRINAALPEAPHE